MCLEEIKEITLYMINLILLMFMEKPNTASEYIVSILLDYQIIRVPFIRQVYPKVFINQYCSRYFLD